MSDIVIILILLAIIGSAVFYIVKSKKSGVKCIGCPSAKTCSSCKDLDDSKQNGCCNCHK